MQTAKELGFAAKLKLAPTALLIIQLCKLLTPLNGGYILYTDNFFTSIKLYKCLRSIGIAACGTAKAGSGFHPSLLAIRDAATKKKDWGLKAYTVVDDEVLCLAWVDNNTVQLMTTAHSISEVNTPHFLPPKRRHGIPANSVKHLPPPYLPSIAAHSPILFNQSGQSGLPIPYPIK